MKRVNKRYSLKRANVISEEWPLGFKSIGLKRKRDITVREARYMFMHIFGINILDREDFDSDKEYSDYNKDMVSHTNDWLDGNIEDFDMMEFLTESYGDDHFGVFNSYHMADYLQKKGII